MLASLAPAYLAIGGIITLGFGIAYLVRSERMARMVGIAIPSASARADYRAIYAGSQIGIGAYFLIAAAVPAWRDPGLLALALFAGGFGLVRLASLAADQRRRDIQWPVGVMETLAGVIALALFLLT